MPWVERSGENSWRVRYRTDNPDKLVDAIPGFTSQQAAQDYVDDMKSEQRKGTWIDPAGGQTVLNDFLPDFWDALDVDIRTEENYRSITRCHIAPRWGESPLAEIANLKIHAWKKTLRDSGLAQVTVDGIIKLLSLMLSDAADEKLIAANPYRPKRRGRRARNTRPAKKIWGEPVEVLDVADQIAAYYGPSGALLEVSGGWTGARWGELTGLHRDNLHLFDDDTGNFVIDPDIGCLHESASGKLWLGPPKTDASARTVSLVPFHVRLLRAHLATHNHPYVFVSPDGQFLRRSNFSRRAQRPACDGNLKVTNPRMRLHPAKPGLTFHGLRHSHKTWMIDDGIPEIAQALRLGHVMPDKVQETYSHVAATVEARLLQLLQDRWEKAVAGAANRHDTSWRNAA